MQRHYNHDSGHKILELPAPNNNKKLQAFIKYLLDTWKTKQSVRDHRILMANQVSLFLNLCWKGLITRRHGVPPLSQQATSPWGHRWSPHVIMAQVTTVRMLPSPGTAHGWIRFVWEALFRLQFPETRRERTVGSGGHITGFSPDRKGVGRGWRKVERGENNRKDVVPLTFSSLGLLPCVPSFSALVLSRRPALTPSPCPWSRYPSRCPRET